MDLSTFDLRFDPRRGGYSAGQPIVGSPFDQAPTGGGLLSGQAAPGPLSGNGGFWNQGWIGPVGAALMGAPTFRQSVANAGAALVPALQQDRRRGAMNKWLIAKSRGGELDPDTVKLLQSDPDLAETIASTLLAPHPKQLAFDAAGNGYLFEPATGDIRPLPPAVAPDAESADGADGAGPAAKTDAGQTGGRARATGGGRSAGPDQAGAPPLPDTVPQGSIYIPRLQLWRAPGGAHFFDVQGNMVQ